eukprot:TRINITY_DN39016_c0_g1_i1.p3 TRINITY_DN39016_c0_g1~~TRINITY_DN39016_c0_g1_i1.p3  ORF type:complete len:104 (-),score=21.73 TRINITY_DN39016_c0_g1_i1:7-318(-)
MKIYKKLFIFIILIINFTNITRYESKTVYYNKITNNEIQKDRLEIIKEKGVLTVASSNDIPFSYIDPKTNEFTGIDADIVKEIAKYLGVPKIEMKKVPPCTLR